jgi:DNA-binding transcriptional LysR family regulator
MEFAQIRYFQNVTDTLNFTEAATRSGVSHRADIAKATPQ